MAEEDDPDFEDDEMEWEIKARKAIETASEDAKLDEVRGVIYLPSGFDHHYDRITEGFVSADDLRQRLTEIGEEEWVAYAPFEHGEAVYEPDVENFVEDVLSQYDVESFFDRLRPPSDAEELTTARLLTPPGAGLVLRVDLSEINDELVRYLALHPEKMRDMEPRKFEELVAALFKAKGYDVQLTPKARDGGFDICAFHRADTGLCMTLIECKRYASHKTVGVEIARGLYGVTDSLKATKELLVTTSYFTKDAKSFQDENKYRLGLADFEDVKLWLNEFERKK